MRLKRILKKFKKNLYLKEQATPVNEQLVLLEAGQGKNLNGNMFAIVREICTNKKWVDLKPIFVVSKNNEEDAKKRFAYYGYQVELVIRNSDQYKRYLATAKYLLTDNSFPPYFLKREEQVYLNTWHGTPLKTLGKSDLKNALSLANIQKNYLMADYALFPNEFTKNVFMKDYLLENIDHGKILLADYPRNAVFLDDENNEALRKKLNLEDKKLIAYMPTWRGSGRNADTKIQQEILDAYFIEIDKQLKDDQIFYVNLHFLLGDSMDYTKYKHIMPFPSEYETYDFLAICDILVTDYSSVFFDFATNKRKVILFAYDIEDYMRDRGTYFPLEDLPFPIVKAVDSLIKEINKKTKNKNMDVFLETYCAYANINTPQMILDLLIHNKKRGLSISKATRNEKETILVYGGKLKNQKLNERLLTYLIDTKKQNPKSHVVLCFSGKITSKKVAFLESLPKNISYYALVSKFEFSVKEKIGLACSTRFLWADKHLHLFGKERLLSERHRLFYGIEPSKVVYFSGNPQYMVRIFSTFDCPKEAHIQHNNVMGIMAHKHAYRIMIAYFKKHYDEVIDHRFDNVKDLWEEEKETYYNKCLKMGNLSYHIHNTKEGCKFSARALAITLLPFSLKNLRVQVGIHTYDAHVKEGIHFGNYIRLTKYSFVIPYGDVRDLEIQNKVNVVFEDCEGYGIKTGIKFNLAHLRKGKNKRGPIHIFEQSETSAYFRQTINNVLYFSVRKKNATDARKEQIKLGFAYYVAKIVPMKKIILLFEKESSRYEESASVLYEKLIDSGQNNAYFILDKSYPHLDRIEEKYKKNIIYKTSFKHYLYFFKSKTFLSSEALVHAIDLRISNKYAQRKLAKKDVNYVFLQHGVMYMVSLDSESRKFFKPKKTKGKYRVVVSSEEEANHFIELGKYNRDMIYISGLPKYDRNVLNESADKIVIMPTWRPWEYNNARYDFEATKYYQMIERIVNTIDKKYREHIVILPHPLFADALGNAEFPLKAYIDSESKYDDVLKETKVLITDYSSIAYDAFYRGSNVIFYWEEKDECLTNYGPTTKLMLNEKNAYGDICYHTKDLKKVFKTNYEQGQASEYVERYQKLVTYHDGKNTERLIACLKNDEII
ncbi:MAG: CDP-glycerol glycerophosphotransferase family protein [Longicatena sp.]